MKNKVYFLSLGISFLIGSVHADSMQTNQHIKIVPPAEFYGDLPSDFKKKIEKEARELKQKGYIEDNSKYPKELLGMAPNHAVRMYAAKKENDDMKNDLVDIHMAFLNFNGISFLPKNKIIGFAPTGTWIKSGWTGIGEIFANDYGGICTFTLLDLDLSGGSSSYNSDTVEYVINNKPSMISVRGNKKMGFIYSVGWSSGNIDYNLSCANKLYNLSYKNRTIDLARRIDNDLKITG